MTLEEKKAEHAAAMGALHVIDQLPTESMRQWALQYIAALEEDIAAHEQGAAARSRDSPIQAGFDWRPWLQMAGEVLLAAIKKHWPTASISAALSALVSFVFNYFQK